MTDPLSPVHNPTTSLTYLGRLSCRVNLPSHGTDPLWSWSFNDSNNICWNWLAKIYLLQSQREVWTLGCSFLASFSTFWVHCHQFGVLEARVMWNDEGVDRVHCSNGMSSYCFMKAVPDVIRWRKTEEHQNERFANQVHSLKFLWLLAHKILWMTHFFYLHDHPPGIPKTHDHLLSLFISLQFSLLAMTSIHIHLIDFFPKCGELCL